MEIKEPVVSIVCITYNHETFISEAIEGFLIQKVNFPVEIIIHDDASTDGTANIVKSYQARNPHLIKAIFQKENQYISRGFGFLADLFEQIKGKYIALCEGDDYWTDPLKLQKQVDFLEANPDFAICFHKVSILEDGFLKDDYITRAVSPITTIRDLAQGNYIHTLSCVFKNNVLNIIGPHCNSSPLGDYYLHMMNAQFGKIYKLDEIMGVYRIHGASVWSSKSTFYRNYKTLEAIRCIVLDLSDEFQDLRQDLMSNHINSIIYIYQNFSNEISYGDFIPDNFENYTIKLLVERIVNQEYQLQKLSSFYGLAGKLVALFKLRLSSGFSSLHRRMLSMFSAQMRQLKSKIG